jgi:histidinol-phosphate aminotransferase
MTLESLIRPNILSLSPYSSARTEFTGEASTFLDANENPYDDACHGYNRYPDPLQRAVKALLAPLKGVSEEQLFLGNGSDEAIDLVYRIFCLPGRSNVVAPAPTYGMYEVCARINDVAYRSVPLRPSDFQLDMPAMKAAIDCETRVVWLCSPNNPTGISFAPEDIEELLRLCPGIVVLDEAYIDFSERPSMLSRLADYPRLIVLQTLSKAWGQAAIRCGMAFAAPEVIAYFNKVKYPYNVPLPTQQQALRALSDVPAKERAVREILAQRTLVADALRALPCCREVFPSDANFLLARFDDANATYDFLVRRGIIVRNRHRVTLCAGCLRITIGTPAENALLLEALRQFSA